MQSESIVHPYDGLLFDPLEWAVLLTFLVLTHVSAPAQLRKPGDDQMPNLVELGITTHKEHVSCNTIRQHLLACDPVVTKCQEYPRDIGLNLCVPDHSQRVEQIHNSFLDQNID